MDWTVLVLHAFWDSWIHERDVLLARGTEHSSGNDATRYAVAYGLFIAAAVAMMFGDQVQQKLKVGGDGGGVFDLDSRGAVTLTVSRAATAGPAAAEVADALAGRSQIAATLGDLPASTRAPLSYLADFFNPLPGRTHTEGPAIMRLRKTAIAVDAGTAATLGEVGGVATPALAMWPATQAHHLRRQGS
jgi:hypothetical protein